MSTTVFAALTEYIVGFTRMADRRAMRWAASLGGM